MLERTWPVVAVASVLALAGACRDKKERANDAARPNEAEASAAARAPASVSATPSASPPQAALDANGQIPLGSLPELQQLLQKGVFETVEREGKTGYEILPDVRIALIQLKDKLLSAVDRNVEELVKAPPTEKPLEKIFVREGAAWAGEQSKDGAIDGTFVPAPQHKDRWLLTLCIRYAPGSDCMAAVYERRGGPVRRMMVFRNDEYSSIEGAVHALKWVISPPDADDRFYVLEAHTYPWPSSNWRDFSYSVVVPGRSPDSCEPMAQDAGFAYWVSGFDLKADPDGFTVGFSAKKDDGGKLTKTVVHRWQKTPGGFQRIHEPAPKPHAK